MHKTEPKIIAPGYSDEEIIEWISRKLRAIRQLENEQLIKAETLTSLENTEERINTLVSAATLDIDR